VPLLARLVSAMAASQTLPKHFTLVRVIPLLDGGLASLPWKLPAIYPAER
jgi:hypothetical protein